MTNTVELVATKEVVLRYHPNRAVASSVLSAPFPIEPGKCETALGEWLATHIVTTRFDDDASACQIVLPHSQASLYLRTMANDLRNHTPAATPKEQERAAAALAEQAKDLLSLLRAYPARALLRLQSVIYRWPVFGRRGTASMTPEQYFDHCAIDIQSSGGVVEYAGLWRKPLPQELVQSTAGGRGAELIGRRHAGRHA
jgi:hypothetical protein